MPDEDYWNSFYDADCMIKTLFGDQLLDGDVVEFGCGYGTFTFPAARHTTGTVLALDIEAELIKQIHEKTRVKGFGNIEAKVRDIIHQGSGLDSGTQTHAMIYNLLHHVDPVDLLKEAYRVLQSGGRLSVIHWRSDIATPRGPALDIRPTAEQCRAWIIEAGFNTVTDVDVSACCEYHFGIIAAR